MTLLVLPTPPSSNRYWRTRVARTRAGRTYVQTYKSPEARAYQLAVANRALVAGLRPLSGDLALVIRWYRARRAGDTSNRIKLIEDALQGVLFENDRQIKRVVAERFEDRLNPRVEVDVWVVA